MTEVGILGYWFEQDKSADCSGHVLLHSGSHFPIKLSKGLTSGLNTCLSTSLKVGGAEWLNALLNEGLGLSFISYLTS